MTIRGGAEAGDSTARAARRFPRLDLGGEHATSLMIQARYPWMEERARLVGETSHSGGIDLGPFRFIRYSARDASRSKLLILVAISVVHGEPRSILLSVSYGPMMNEFGRRRSSGTPESKLIEITEALGEPSWMRARVDYRFTGRDPDRLWFPLPTSLAGRGEGEIFEIRGVRGAKRAEDGTGVEYTFILDRPSNETIYLSAEFALDGPFTPETVREALGRADRLVPELV